MVTEQELLELITTNLHKAVELNASEEIETLSRAYQRVKSVQTQQYNQSLGEINA